jgi:5'-3' exonuclease
MTVALLDGDIIAYQAAVYGEEEDYFGDGAPTLDRQKAFESTATQVARWTKEADAKSAVVVFSGMDNFRYEILPTYKHNRKAEKPALYAEVVAHMEANFKCLRKNRLEADDTLGILGTSDPKKYVVVSIDKDMRTLPCRVLIPGKMPIPKLFKQVEADHYWMTQTLTGDTTDGYSGCPGIGPVKAARILEGHLKLDGMWAAVVAAYKEKGLAENDALVQARVARILRTTDFDRTTREIILWTPKSTGASAAALISTEPGSYSTGIPVEPTGGRTEARNPAEGKDSKPKRRRKRSS